MNEDDKLLKFDFLEGTGVRCLQNLLPALDALELYASQSFTQN